MSLCCNCKHGLTCVSTFHLHQGISLYPIIKFKYVLKKHVIKSSTLCNKEFIILFQWYAQYITQECVCVCGAVMNVCICDIMLAGVRSQCLLAGLFRWLPMGLNLTRGICCPLPILCPSAPSFICAHGLLLPHTYTEKNNRCGVIEWEYKKCLSCFRCTINLECMNFGIPAFALRWKGWRRMQIKGSGWHSSDRVGFGSTGGGQWKREKVIRARRSENGVKRYILAQLGSVGTAVPTLATYLFMCIQVTA